MGAHALLTATRNSHSVSACEHIPTSKLEALSLHAYLWHDLMRKSDAHSAAPVYDKATPACCMYMWH